MSTVAASRSGRNSSRRQPWRIAGVAMLCAAMLGSLSACTASAGGSSAESSAAGLVVGGASSNDLAAAPAASASAAKAGSGARADQSVTITGTLTLTAADPIHAASTISTIVVGSGGRIASSTEEPKHDASAALTARIPAAGFDATLRAIERKGHVTNATMRTTDVSTRVTDDAVRIRTLQQSIARLQALLGRASTTTDLVAIESSLESRETDLEVMLANQKGLADQISYATLSISIFEPSAAPRPKPTNFGGAVVAGFAALESTVATVVVGLGYALPWLVLVALLVAAALFIRRVMGRRRRDSAQPSV